MYSGLAQQGITTNGRKRFRPQLSHRAEWLVLFFAFLVFTVSAKAQLDTGSIRGVISDPSGKVVQGADITARETTSGTSYSTTSSETGYYSLPSVRPGTYEVKVTAKGFKAGVYNGVIVTVSSQISRDVVLALGSASESIEVNAGTVSLEKESSDIDASISPEQV